MPGIPSRLPASLRNGRVLSAVYRVTSPVANGGRQGLALRLHGRPETPRRRGPGRSGRDAQSESTVVSYDY